MPIEEIAITEIEEFEPSRVDGVGKAANGFPILMLKSMGDGEVIETEATIEDVLAELDKAASDDRPPCPLCDGKKTIRGGNLSCPKCKGTGMAPKVGESTKELAEAAKEAGVAASGADVAVDSKCAACMGTGKDESGVCDACAGTGMDADAPAASELNAVNADAGKITEGAGGRESVDKSLEESSSFAKDWAKWDAEHGGGGGGFSDSEKQDWQGAHDKAEPAAHKAAASHRQKINDIYSAQGKTYSSSDSAKNARQQADSEERKGIIAAGKGDVKGAGKHAGKAAGLRRAAADMESGAIKASADGSTFTAPNPAMSGPSSSDDLGIDPTTVPFDDDADDSGDGSTPGSPAWEAVDAQMATDAAMALMAAAELIRQFGQREMQEVAAGEGNDIFDAGAAQAAMCGVSDALGIMAQMAFHEGLEAAKSLSDDEVVEKAGRRLAGKTISALAAARDKAKDLADHIGGVLGADDPKKKNPDSGIKAAADILSKEIDDMTGDELLQLLDEREAQKAASAEAAEKATAQDVDNSDSIAGGKAANSKAKGKKPKAGDTDLEDEATDNDDGTPDSPKGAAKSTDEGDTDVTDTDTDVDTEATKAEKPELTPEQIEAKKAAKDAKKVAKAARKAEKELATKVALTKSIEESLKTVVEQNEVLKSTVDTLTSELEGVKKMAAPSTIVRQAPADAQNVAKARDEVEIRIATLEAEARSTSDPAVRAGNREIIKELRADMTAPKN